jgi:hypothetical protein
MEGEILFFVTLSEVEMQQKKVATESLLERPMSLNQGF